MQGYVFSPKIFIYFICIAPLAIALQSRGLGDADIISQVKFGQIFLEGNSLLPSFPIEVSTTLNLGRFSQILFAFAYQLGGWNIVRGFNSALIATALILMLIPLIRLYGRVEIGLIVSILAGLLLLPHVWVRPQSFALLFFSILYFISINKKIHVWLKLFLASACLILWQNFHPSTLMAVPILCIFIFSSRKECNPILLGILIFVAWSIAQICTADGFAGLQASSINLRISKHVMGITEWLPAWHVSIRDVLWPFLFVASVSCLFSIVLWRKLNKINIFLNFVYLIPALIAARFAVFYALASMPFWYNLAVIILPNRYNLSQSPLRIFATLEFILLLCVSFFLPLRLEPNLSWQLINESLNSKDNLKIFNCRELAGPIISLAYPNAKIYFDGRLYLQTEDRWRFYQNASFGYLELKEILNYSPADLFILCKSYQHPLIDIISKSADWKLDSEDSYTAIFKRK